MANWSDLHKDILSLIIKLITNPTDHIHVSSICKSWRSVAFTHRCTLPHPIPGLMVAPKSSLKRKFLTFPEQSPPSDEHDHDRDLPILKRQKCCGSYKGWLVLTTDDPYSVYLYNPFKKRLNLLPSLVNNRVYKAVLSSSPSFDVNCTVLILFEREGAAFCRVGDVSWTVFTYAADDSDNHGFSDAVFLRKRVYVVSDYGRVYTCSNLDHAFLEKIACDHITSYDIPRFARKYYLVALKGQLCRILREFETLDDLYFGDGMHDDQGGLHYNNTGKNSSIDSTREFRVWRYDPGVEKWIRMHELGAHALFLGNNNSVALCEWDTDGRVKGNRIYFTDDRQRYKHFGFSWSGKDMGIYNMEDSSIGPLLSDECEWEVDLPSVWVTPLPW